MARRSLVFLAPRAVLLALLAFACGRGGPRGAAPLIARFSTGRIDARNYTFVTRDDCIDLAESAGCSTKWCNDGLRTLALRERLLSVRVGAVPTDSAHRV